MKNKRVRTLLIAAAVLIVLGAAIWLIARSVRSQTVNVYAVTDVAEGYYQDNSELEAQVSEGSAETVPLDEGMVESIAVKVGDAVKKGDLLLTYDTSSYQLTLSSDQAEIAMLQSQIAQAQQDIAAYRNMTPSEQVIHTPAPTPTPKPVPGTYSVISPETQISGSEDGTDYYNCTTKTVVQGKALLALRDSGRTVSYRLYSGSDLLGVWTVSGEALSKAHKEDWSPKDWTLGSGIRLSGDGTVTVDFSKTHYGSFSSMIPEEDDGAAWIDDWDEPDNGSYYTAAEIAEMIREKNESIVQFQRDLRQAQLKYQRDQLTGKSGEVRAKSDGVVTQVGDPHAIAVGEALVTIKSNTRAQITVYVDELSLDLLKPGDSVNVYTYESGSSFTATVESVGTKPAEDYGYYGAPSSFYPVTCVADDETAEVRAWEYCSVTLDSVGSGDSSKLYLPLFFVREDSSGSYVFRQGENGRLEKQYVSTGAILWGSSVEIRGGLTFEDFVAFPYGRGVQAGNPTQVAATDELYNTY